MKNIYKVLLSFLPIAFAVTSVDAQMISGNVFMKGDHIEVGIAPNGSFGTGVDAPTGYHARPGWGTQLGFVADPALDGWAVGTPNYIGCYFLPGVPQEGWDISIGGTWYRAYRDFGATSFLPAGWSGSNSAPYIEGSRKKSVWNGTIGTLEIEAVTSFDTTQVFFFVDVKLKNTGGTTLTNIYYSRTLDPDNESMVPGGGGPTTTNLIESQPDLSGSGDYRALVSATGLSFPGLSYLGIGAVDCRARVYIYPGVLTPSVGPDNIDGYPFETDRDYTNEADCAIGINFNIGDLAPGDSTVFTYSYILSSDDLDTAFSSLNSGWQIDGTLYETTSDTFNYIICRGADSLKVEVAGGGGFIWGDWSPNVGLAVPSGRVNTIAMPGSATTYRIIGTTPTCPVSDTLYLTITPVGDTTLLSASICAGSVYDFDGDLLFNTGVYYKTYVTAMSGCDSVTKLTLSMNPLPGVDITVDNSSLCEGDVATFQVLNPTSGTTYQWIRNGAPIAGATEKFYVASSMAGEYRVIGITDKGCVDTSRRITLTINPAASVDIQDLDIMKVCIGDTIDLSVDAKPGYEYYWEPEKSFRYTSGARLPKVRGIMYEEFNEIKVRAINEFGCIAYDDMIVKAVPCCDVYLPTAFTPNGDGVNDYFTMLLREGQKIVTFQIFDRYGKMVYDNGSKMGWSGRDLDGNDVAQGAVYFFRIVYSCSDKQNYEVKGDVTLIR